MYLNWSAIEVWWAGLYWGVRNSNFSFGSFPLFLSLFRLLKYPFLSCWCGSDLAFYLSAVFSVLIICTPVDHGNSLCLLVVSRWFHPLLAPPLLNWDGLNNLRSHWACASTFSSLTKVEEVFYSIDRYSYWAHRNERTPCPVFPGEAKHSFSISWRKMARYRIINRKKSWWLLYVPSSWGKYNRKHGLLVHHNWTLKILWISQVYLVYVC